MQDETHRRADFERRIKGFVKGVSAISRQILDRPANDTLAEIMAIEKNLGLDKLGISLTNWSMRPSTRTGSTAKSSDAIGIYGR